MMALRLLSFATVRPDADPEWIDQVPAALKRRDPRIWQMAYLAAARAIAGISVSPRSIVSATALGALDETQAFLEALFRTGLGSPRNFMASVHNSMAGKLAIECAVTGPNLTLCDGVNSLASALGAAALLDANAFPCLVLLSDEKTAFLKKLAPHLPPSCGFLAGDAWEEGSAAFIVAPDGASKGIRIRAAGPAPAGHQTPLHACNGLAASLGAALCDSAAIGKASDSFVKPGFLLHDLAQRQSAGLIPTYDPRSHAAAVISVCP